MRAFGYRWHGGGGGGNWWHGGVMLIARVRGGTVRPLVRSGALIPLRSNSEMRLPLLEADVLKQVLVLWYCHATKKYNIIHYNNNQI